MLAFILVGNLEPEIPRHGEGDFHAACPVDELGARHHQQVFEELMPRPAGSSSRATLIADRRRVEQQAVEKGALLRVGIKAIERCRGVSDLHLIPGTIRPDENIIGDVDGARRPLAAKVRQRSVERRPDFTGSDRGEQGYANRARARLSSRLHSRRASS